MKNRLKTLEELEAYHSGMLVHLRAMIAAERGQPVRQDTRNGAAEQPEREFSKLTKAAAVALILREKGEMHVSKIFTSMKRRGNPIKSKSSLSNLLSTNEKFEKRGKGVWALAQENRQ